jgi:hypothetical protein
MKDAYIVIACGSRDYDDREKVYHVLDAYYGRIGPKMLLLNGGARGADTLAREWAVDRQVDHMTLYAKWELFGRSAGPIRNRRMAKRKPRLVLAFHPDIDKSKGTADMIDIAERRDIKYKVFR